MKDIKQVYYRLQEKRRRKNELAKMIRDDLANNAEYQRIVEEMRVLREQKRSIESEVKASCLSDVAEIDTLKLGIGADSELLSDIALTMYANRETVEILDEERGLRYTPVFSVKFAKENLESAEVREIRQVNREKIEKALAAA